MKKNESMREKCDTLYEKIRELSDELLKLQNQPDSSKERPSLSPKRLASLFLDKQVGFNE